LGKLQAKKNGEIRYMATENNSKPVSRSTMPQIIFGALVGILLGIAGVLIYQGYLGQITNILLYVSLVFFGVVVLTFILVWGFKTYLTRLIFGSKVADSPDLIAEAQNIASQLSDGVIDKVMENATPEQRENAKGLVLRLGNWFLWGRLRNWWWSWILGIFVSLGGLTGTLLLVNQNELLQNQNQLIKNQMSLEEASRRGALVMLMSNIFDKVDDEIAEQKAEMRRKGRKVNGDTKFTISQSLIGQIVALSQAFKPYKFLDGDTLIQRPLSPERGLLLITISQLPLYSEILDDIFLLSTFEYADLRGADLSVAYLSKAKLNYCDLTKADLDIVNLNEAWLIGANLTEVNLFSHNLKNTIFGNANFSKANLTDADFTDASLASANLNGADLSGADLSKELDLTVDQIIKARTLYKCTLPKNIDVEKLKKEKPELFKKPKTMRIFE